MKQMSDKERQQYLSGIDDVNKEINKALKINSLHRVQQIYKAIGDGFSRYVKYDSDSDLFFYRTGVAKACKFFCDNGRILKR